MKAMPIRIFLVLLILVLINPSLSLAAWDKYCGRYCSVTGPLQYAVEFDVDKSPQMKLSEARKVIVQSLERMNEGLSKISVTSTGVCASRGGKGHAGCLRFNQYNYLTIRLQEKRGIYYLDHEKWSSGGPFGSWAGGEWNDPEDGKLFVDAFAALKYYEKHPSPELPSDDAATAPTSNNALKSDIDDLPAIKAKPNKNSYAIVIGIEQYRQKLPKADFAVSDAKLVSEYLSKVMGYPEENIVTLTNEHASKSDFEKYFEKWLSNNAEKDSTVFVYYSGHGAPNTKTGDAYLVPYDGDPSFIEQTGYPLKKLYESLNKLQAKEIIVALDSCFSGAGGRSVIAKGARPLVMNLQSNMALSKNITVMSASSGDQISSTYDEKGHGLFTYFMLKGIKNEDVVRKDGSIAISDLFSFIKPQVERIARKQYNNEQSPQLIGAKKN
jgi:hypothetical protein